VVVVVVMMMMMMMMMLLLLLLLLLSSSSSSSSSSSLLLVVVVFVFTNINIVINNLSLNLTSASVNWVNIKRFVGKPFIGTLADYDKRKETYQRWSTVKDKDSFPPYIAIQRPSRCPKGKLP